MCVFLLNLASKLFPKSRSHHFRENEAIFRFLSSVEVTALVKLKIPPDKPALSPGEAIDINFN